MLEALEPRVLLSGSVVITEFMAKNTNGLKDQDGDNSDWVELYNSGSSAVNLNGYYLTDDAANLTKWKFPDDTLGAGSYIVVFASGKDRKVSGQELHTNFSLATSGEYLALVEPNGSTIDSQYSPNFPAQYPDVSYGLANLDTSTTLVHSTDTARCHVPTSPADDAAWMTSGFNDSSWTAGKAAIGFDTDTTTTTSPQTLLDYGASAYALVPSTDIGTTWRNPGFTPTGWLSGTTGVGYEMASGYETVIGLNVATQMHGVRSSCYIRIDFDCPDPSTISALTLSLRVDDGCVVWLNGNAAPIKSINAPATLAWNSAATSQPDDPTGYTDYDITPYIGQLVAGRNVLAIQGLNCVPTADSDFLVIPKITATVNATTSDFGPLIQTNVQTAMKDVNATAYTRIPFTVADPSVLESLMLKMKYDDGFIAYINGTQVASRNAPASPTYSSAATAENDDESAVQDESFDLTPYLALIHSGTNVLAIQAMNVAASDTDFLLSPTLVAKVTPTGAIEERYFQVPTPGDVNSVGVNELGPIVTHVNHFPQTPADANPLTVTASVAKASSAITSVVLHYRVNWNTETTLTMYDDGAHGDGAAGDGVYGAVIPASASAPGQMVRWYVTATDSASHTTRMPLFLDPEKSEQYYGTVVADPSIVSNLPVYQWFVQNPSAADTTVGAPASLYYAGEFYDNVNVRLRGGTSATYPKKSYKFDLPKDHQFLFSPSETRRDEFDLNTTYSDKSDVRPILSYESFRDAGVPYCETFPVRLQQNGSFFSVPIFIEQPDADYLKRNGLDKDGDLYKIVQGHLPFSSTIGVEKDTNTDSPTSDMLEFMTNLKVNNATRVSYMFDHLDISECVDYLAVLYLLNDSDSVRKNFYLYEDLNTHVWSILPWDKDLTFGRHNNGDVLNDDMSYQGEPTDPWLISNEIADIIVNNPQTKAMYLRRVRTLYDQLFQSSATPAAQLKYEARIDQLVAQIGNDATLDARWRPYAYGSDQTIVQATNILKTQFLAPRRRFIESDGFIPAAQWAPFANQITIGTVDFSPASGDQNQEYIQLTNPQGYAVDISGWKLTGGIDYTFAGGTVLAPGASVYVAADLNAFRARTSGPRGGQGLYVVGPYAGHMDNTGETLHLVAANNMLISSRSYNATQPVINEVMTNNGDAGDWIELFNPTGGAVDLSGWYLSDSSASLQKFAIPAGTAIPSNGYAVFTEAQFGSAFKLSKNGESIYLSNTAGAVIDSDDFGGSDTGVTFGRYLNRDGHWTFTALTTPTMGGANSTPLVGPVVIDEIMYHPLDGNDEFVELRNITDSPVKLYDAASPAHTWTLSGGADFTLPAATEIPAQGLLVLTSADVSTPALKSAFKAKYNIPANVDVLGPWLGNLNNAGDHVNLNKPLSVDPTDGTYAMIRVDRVEYWPSYPWAVEADGTGKSLERIVLTNYGDDPFNWQSFRTSPGLPTVLAGDANLDGHVTFADYIILEASFGNVGTQLAADFNGDGIVNFRDYIMLEANFGKTIPLPSAPAMAPLASIVLSAGPILSGAAGPVQDATVQTRIIATKPAATWASSRSTSLLNSITRDEDLHIL